MTLVIYQGHKKRFDRLTRRNPKMDCCNDYIDWALVLSLGLEENYPYQDPRYYCYNCAHLHDLHNTNSCTTSIKTRKEWYILGKVKLAEAVVPEPCKCKKFVSRDKLSPSDIDSN